MTKLTNTQARGSTIRAFAQSLGGAVAVSLALGLPAWADSTAEGTPGDLGGAAGAYADRDTEETPSEANDPFEPANRVVFEINMALDRVILKPTAQVYDFITPGFVQSGVTNFFRNLDGPNIFVNDLLQGEVDRAGTTGARFLINSTVGVAGLWDPATEFGLDRHSEDFGQTLAVWGFGEGPYLYLPLLGPSNPRDLTGFMVDRTVLNPFWYLDDYADDEEPNSDLDTYFDEYDHYLTVLNIVNVRAQNLGTLEEIERTSVDFYASIRSLYRQSREGAIRNGEFDPGNLPDIDELE